MEQTAVTVQLSVETSSFLVPLLQRHEIPILPAAEHRRFLPVIGVWRVAWFVKRRQLVPADEVVSKSDVDEVFGGGGRGAILVKPDAERQSGGAAIAGEIEQTVRMETRGWLIMKARKMVGKKRDHGGINGVSGNSDGSIKWGVK